MLTPYQQMFLIFHLLIGLYTLYQIYKNHLLRFRLRYRIDLLRVVLLKFYFLKFVFYKIA
jgi:hypothetical protein